MYHFRDFTDSFHWCFRHISKIRCESIMVEGKWAKPGVNSQPSPWTGLELTGFTLCWWAKPGGQRGPKAAALRTFKELAIQYIRVECWRHQTWHLTWSPHTTRRPGQALSWVECQGRQQLVQCLEFFFVSPHPKGKLWNLGAGFKYFSTMTMYVIGIQNVLTNKYASWNPPLIYKVTWQLSVFAR